MVRSTPAEKSWVDTARIVGAPCPLRRSLRDQLRREPMQGDGNLSRFDVARVSRETAEACRVVACLSVVAEGCACSVGLWGYADMKRCTPCALAVTNSRSLSRDSWRTVGLWVLFLRVGNTRLCIIRHRCRIHIGI